MKIDLSFQGPEINLKIVGKVAVLIFAFCFSGFTSVLPQNREATDQSEVKALFLFNFAQFVEWPQDVLPPDSTIVIGILGKDPFGLYLDETVRDEVVNGHAVKVERYSAMDQVGTCHILFISSSRSIRIDNVLKRLKGKSILTVSDNANFAKYGGMIRFMNEDDKIKLRINLKAVKESNISISSKLLSLSEIVE